MRGTRGWKQRIMSPAVLSARRLGEFSNLEKIPDLRALSVQFVPVLSREETLSIVHNLFSLLSESDVTRVDVWGMF